MEKWKIELDENPLQLEAYRCTPSIVLGNGKKPFNLKNIKRDFSHEFNGPLKQKKIKSWAIMYSSYSKREFNTFISNLKDTVTKDFTYACSRPIEYQINGKDR